MQKKISTGTLYSIVMNLSTNKLVSIIYALVFVILILYTDEWLFSNSYFVIFELGGPIPLHSNIWLMNSYLSYFENLGVRGLYGIGWPSYLIIYLLSLTSHIGGVGIGERIWFLSDILVSIIFSYKLFDLILKNRNVSYIFALIYTFSPAVAVLTYGTSWETFLFYAFAPLVLYLLYKAFNSNKLKSWSFVLILTSVFMYVYYFDAGVIMWEGVLVFFMFIYFTFIHINKNKMLINSGKLGLFIILFIFFSNSIVLITSFIHGHGASAFSGTDFGATSIKDVLIDLEENFNGYWSYTYAYFMWALTLFFFFLFVYFRKKIKMKEVMASLLSLNFLILIVWTIFRFNIEPIAILISKYIPIVGEYSFSSIFNLISNTIILAAISFQLLLNYDLRNNLSKKLNRKLINKETIILIVAIVLMVLLVMTPLDYGHTEFPSDIELHNHSQKFLNSYDVPTNITILSNWFFKNTNINSGYRTYLGPASTSTYQAIKNMMDFTSTVNLSTSAGNAISTMEYDGNLTPLAGVLAMEGVEYFIIYRGPNIHTNLNYTGPASFGQYGWPWQLSYAPVGSWQNWTILLNKSPAFRMVANITGSIIYKNLYYTGIAYAYNINDQNFSYIMNNSLNPLKYGFYGNDIEYLSNSQNITNWSFVDYNIWSINNEFHTYKIINSSSHFETSITSILNVTQGSFYYFRYSIEGHNMTYNVVMIRWYSSNGTQIGTIASNDFSGNPWEGNITNFSRGAFLVHAPRNATEAYIQLVVNIINGTTTEFKNITVTNVITLKANRLNYTFVKPYYIEIKNVPKNSLIVLNANYFNGWKINHNNAVNRPFSNHIYVVNSFLYRGNFSNITIILTTQKNYDSFLLSQWIVWIIIFLSVPIIYVMDMRNHWRIN